MQIKYNNPYTGQLLSPNRCSVNGRDEHPCILALIEISAVFHYMYIYMHVVISHCSQVIHSSDSYLRV